MAILDTDILYRLSVTTGPGESTAQANANLSLGEFMSSTGLDLVTSLNNLFDDISGAENAASDVEYRCIFAMNNHATLTLQAARVWIESQVAGGAAIAIGLDPAGVVDGDSAVAQAAEIANESTAPTGVTFTTPTDYATGLVIGDIAPGQCQAIWIRRTAAASSALDDDGGTLTVRGDTAA